MYGRYIVLSQYNVRAYTIKDSSVVHTNAFLVRIQRTKLPVFHTLARRHRRVIDESVIDESVIDESSTSPGMYVRGGDFLATDRDEITSGATTREVDDEGARGEKKTMGRDGGRGDATSCDARARTGASERASER